MKLKRMIVTVLSTVLLTGLFGLPNTAAADKSTLKAVSMGGR